MLQSSIWGRRVQGLGGSLSLIASLFLTGCGPQLEREDDGKMIRVVVKESTMTVTFAIAKDSKSPSDIQELIKGSSIPGVNGLPLVKRTLGLGCAHVSESTGNLVKSSEQEYDLAHLDLAALDDYEKRIAQMETHFPEAKPYTIYFKELIQAEKEKRAQGIAEQKAGAYFLCMDSKGTYEKVQISEGQDDISYTFRPGGVLDNGQQQYHDADMHVFLKDSGMQWLSRTLTPPQQLDWCVTNFSVYDSKGNLITQGILQDSSTPVEWVRRYLNWSQTLDQSQQFPKESPTSRVIQGCIKRATDWINQAVPSAP